MSPLPAAILAGGASRRFGSDKAQARFRGATLLRTVATALRRGGCDPVVQLGGSPTADGSVVVVPDRRPGEGPLAGTAAALAWAKTGRVLVVPCDLPLLSERDVSRFVAWHHSYPDATSALVASHQGIPQVQLAAWPTAMLPAVLATLDRGSRRWNELLDCVEWVTIEVPRTAVHDTDTVEALVALDQSDAKETS